jgi:hypothetical protein
MEGEKQGRSVQCRCAASDTGQQRPSDRPVNQRHGDEGEHKIHHADRHRSVHRAFRRGTRSCQEFGGVVHDEVDAAEIAN